MRRKTIIGSLLALATVLLAAPPSGAAPAASRATASARPAAAPDGGGQYVSLSPARVVDTNAGIGAPHHSIAAHATLTVQITGRGGVPTSGVSAAALTIAITNPAQTGWLTVSPSGHPRPTAVNVGFTRTQHIADLVIATLGTNGRIDLYNNSTGTINLAGDVSGYYRSGTPTTAGTFAALTPARVVDTNAGIGAPHHSIAAHATLTVQITGRGGVPTSGVSAAALTIAITNPAQTGWLTVSPSGHPRPTAVNVGFTRTQHIADLVIATLGTNGRIDLYNNSTGTINLAGDVSGYYRSGTPTTAGTFAALTPARVVDTNAGIGAPHHSIAAHATLTVQITGRGGVPTSGVSAAALTIAITNPAQTGWLTVSPSGHPRPTAVNVGFTRTQHIADLVIATLGTNGRIDLYNNSTGTINLAGDVSGYYREPAPVAGLSVSATADAATLGWTPPSDPGVARVELRRQNGATGPATPDAGTFVADLDASAVSYVDSDLTPSTRYAYSLFALDPGTGFSPASSATVTTGATGATWSAPVTTDVSLGSPRSISCPTATFCGAVDDRGGLLTYDGTSWTRTELAGVRWVSVSCPADGFCAAVDTTGTAVTLDGTQWSARATSGVTGPTSVSCSSSTFCLTVGGASAASYDGTTWTSMPQIDSSGALTGVSCVSSSECVAVDTTGQALTYDGEGWSTPVDVDGTNPLAAVSCADTGSCRAVDTSGNVVSRSDSSWSAPVSADAGHALRSVSCPATDFCVAVDDAGRAVDLADSPGAPQPIDPGPDLRSVSCSSATRCLAVDGSTGTLITLDGTTWGTPAAFDPDRGGFNGVSCPTTSFCAAIDRSGQALTFADGTWGSPEVVAPRALDEISCASTTFCMAIDSAGEVVRYDGSAWSAPTKIMSPQFGASISCPTATFCVAADDTGAVSTFTGTSWSGPTRIGPWRSGQTVSCASAKFCVIVVNGGGVATFDGSRWQVSADSISGAALSCPTETFCMVIRTDSGVMTFDGHRWTSVAVPQLPGAEFLTSVSCASSANCTLATQRDTVLTYDGAALGPLVRLAHPYGGLVTQVVCPTSTHCVLAADSPTSAQVLTYS